MNIPDGNILTSIMNDFVAITSTSRTKVEPYALKVLGTLITIDLLIASILMLIEDLPMGKQILSRTLKYGGFAFMVLSYQTIINALSSSFVMIGLKAAGDTITAKTFTNPSLITDIGFKLIGPFTQNIADGKTFGADHGGVIDKVLSMPSVLMLGLTYMMILFCFFLIAVNIFITYVEFAIFTSIALILVPFGVWEKTEFIFDKVKNGVINYGIKFMTLSFIISISFNIIKKWQLPPDPTFNQALYVLLGIFAITYLCWHAPSVAAGFAGGGGGSMTGAALGGFAGAAAGNVANVGSGAGKALVGGVNPTTGNRGGILPTLGRVTGVTNRVQSAADQLKDMGSDFGGKVAQKFGSKNNSTPPPAAPSGVDLNSDKPD